jgi:hypothetical protein
MGISFLAKSPAILFQSFFPFPFPALGFTITSHALFPLSSSILRSGLSGANMEINQLTKKNGSLHNNYYVNKVLKTPKKMFTITGLCPGGTVS